MLRRLASGKSHASHVTKTLHIGSLSPRLSRYCPDSTLDGEDKVLAVEAEIRENLEKALLSLRSVESFWCVWRSLRVSRNLIIMSI